LGFFSHHGEPACSSLQVVGRELCPCSAATPVMVEHPKPDRQLKC
jgi:hypothetical protein